MDQPTPCIGLDFDNTIVCYDQIFHKAAVERNLIPKDISPFKESIRDYLRSIDREKEWTLLQGYVYGARMEEALPFPGLLDFLQTVKQLGFKITIISHKTKTPYLGPAYDLHQAAQDWMTRQRFFDSSSADIKLEDVSFEVSKEKKLQRIAATGCHLFIDDLPELLADSDFPNQVQRVLFSSNNINPIQGDCLTAKTWEELLILVKNHFSSYGD